MFNLEAFKTEWIQYFLTVFKLFWTDEIFKNNDGSNKENSVFLVYQSINESSYLMLANFFNQEAKGILQLKIYKNSFDFF